MSRTVGPILREVNWHVGRGEHWAVLGPNGSGKTSLLRVLTGYMPFSSGVIRVLGQTYGRADWRELRARIGLVSSSLQASIPPDETAVETAISGRYGQLDLWARITPADRTAARRALRQVGAANLADRPWLHLSQGERQRVLIARALLARPRLLILDEPCAGLDPVARERFLQSLDRLAQLPRAPTLVLVTHHVEEITPAFTHALLLREGKVVSSGKKAAVLTSAALAKTFGASLRLQKRDGRYCLAVQERARARSW